MAAIALPPLDIARGLHREAWLAARAARLVLTVLAPGLFIASLSDRYQQLHALRAGDQSSVAAIRGIDPMPIQAALTRLNLPVGLYAAGTVAFEVGFALVFGLVALAVARHKQNRWLSLVISLALVLVGTTYPPTLDALVRDQPAWEFAVRLLESLSFALALIVFYVFPDGRFTPRWTAPLAAVWVGWEVASALFPAAPFSLFAAPPLWSLLLTLPWWLSGVVAQVYRYRRVSGPAQRQQTKWVLYGIAAAAVGSNAALLVPYLIDRSRTPSVGEALIELGATPLADVFVLLAGLSLGIAILHYRLWDIDLLINRTLVYVPLTAIIAGLFAAGLGVSQRLFVALTGDKSDAAVVLTTLVVAAVFEPIHTGLKATVDKRFREAPDRARELKAFADDVRLVVQVIDVARVTRRFLDAAVVAFEAECGAVQVQGGGDEQMTYTRGEWHDDRARLSVPLESGGVRVGLVALGARRGGAEYAAADHQMLRSIAEMVATVICLAGSPSVEPEARRGRLGPVV